MLAAGAQPQAEAGLVQHHIGDYQGDHRQQHAPVELKAADVHQECLAAVQVLDGGGHVVRIGGGVHGLHEHQCLVRLEVHGRHRQQQGVDHAQQDTGQHRQQHHHKGGGACRQELHHQRTAQGAHDHDALQADVDDAGVFREAAAQRHQQQDGGENQRVLQQQ